MRIVHYCRHALAGETGVANAARGWASTVAQLGEDVALAVDASQCHLPAPDGVETLPIPHLTRASLPAPRVLNQALRGADLLVLHGGWDPSATMTAHLAARAAVPYMPLTHGVYYPAALDRHRTRKRLWATLFERRMLRRAAAVHLLFRDEEEGLARLGVAPRLVVATNGIDPPPDIHWDGGSANHLLYLGRYDPTHKGLDLLLHALAHLPPGTRPRVRMHGPDWHGGRSTVAALVATLGLEEWVTLGDSIHGDAKWDLLRTARALVLTSRWEAAPMGLAEAAAIGLPALVTDYPMGRWLAARDAAVMASRDPAGLAQGITDVMAPEAAHVGERARTIACEELSWDAVARSWLAQVRDVPLPGAS